MMRKLLALILSLAFAVTALGGCAPAETPEHSPITFTEEELSRETKLVVDPSVTGTITVRYFFWVTEDPNFMYNAAAEVFREYYPNAEVIFEPVNSLAVPEQEYYTNLATELMAGSGPDVAFQYLEPCRMRAVIDPYKMMKAGAFLDLTDYFRADETYNPSDFNQTVLQAGQWDGRQYLIPADYSIPLFMTTRKMADEVGFHPENCTDYIRTLEEMISITEENPLSLSQRGQIYKCATPFYAPLFIGSHWSDHQSGTIHIDTPEMKKFYELIKEYLLPYRTSRQNDVIGPGTLYSTALTSPSAYFVDANRASYEGLFSNMQLIEQAGDTPILLPWRTFDGKVEAYCNQFIGVNRNTKNPEAAYHFIRTWLSQEYLMKEGSWGNNGYTPLNYKAIDLYLQKAREPAYMYYSEMGGEGQVVELKGLSQESAEKYLALLDEIDYCTLDNPTIYMVWEAMEDYYSGARSYESCISEVQSKLEIYLTE